MRRVGWFRALGCFGCLWLRAFVILMGFRAQGLLLCRGFYEKVR